MRSHHEHHWKSIVTNEPSIEVGSIAQSPILGTEQSGDRIPSDSSDLSADSSAIQLVLGIVREWKTSERQIAQAEQIIRVLAAERDKTIMATAAEARIAFNSGESHDQLKVDELSRRAAIIAIENNGAIDYSVI